MCLDLCIVKDNILPFIFILTNYFLKKLWIFLLICQNFSDINVMLCYNMYNALVFLSSNFPDNKI